jgi:uncharacterized membrane-anchored protein YitT (DUF2179 family)
MKTQAREFANWALIVLGIFSAGLGLKGFLVPSGFIDGGVTGVSMLTATLSTIPLWFLLLVINAPFVFLGYRQVGKVFALKSALAISGLALCIGLFKFPIVTQDKLLTAVFGGFFLGAGIGLAIRGGSVLDGTEIAALIVGKKFGITIGDIILVLNIAIFLVAAIFLGIEPALYSMLTYFSVSKTIDFIIHGIEEYNGVIILSSRSSKIKEAILDELGRGVTVYKAEGGMTAIEHETLFCVVTRLELHKLRSLVNEIDESAFVVIHQISDVSGGMVKKRVLH